MDIVIILLLIILNGVFAMSELAIVSARKIRLEQAASAGDGQARLALELMASPNRFLSTVQIGITLIGVLAGAFGGATVANQVADRIATVEALAPYSQQLGFALVVATTTYLSLVIGELVPKQIALANPEAIAQRVARPMVWLSAMTAPLVYLLSKSTDLIVRILPLPGSDMPDVTELDVLSMIEQGMHSGVFEAREHDMVEGIFRLDERRAGGLITPRREIIYLDINDSTDRIRDKLTEHIYTTYPVCDGSIDNVLGLVIAKDLLPPLFAGDELDLRQILRKPIYLPNSLPASAVLRRLKQHGMQMALVVDEYGGIDGLITMHDIMEEIVGDIDAGEDETLMKAIRRNDGSWLIDGGLPLFRLEDIFPTFTPPEDEKGDYETLAGFIMMRIGRIPQPADSFEWGDLIFEVVDMDEVKIDKVMIRQKTEDER